MDPEVGHSVARTGANPDRWVLGLSMVCEKAASGPESVPADAITHWYDDESTILFLRKRSPDEPLGGDFEAGRVHVGGTSAAVWCLGKNTFCKARAWVEGLELEANNLRVVAEKLPDVPIPEAIHPWIDRDLPSNRTFLLVKRVNGQPLTNVWLRLSDADAQRISAAEYVARVCVTLAAVTSPRFETITGCGIYEPYLAQRAPQPHPTWKPRLMGPFAAEPMSAYMTEIWTMPPPEVEPTFHFYHADLGPTNIMVSEDGSVSGIIDWESAAFYPRFFLATKPTTSGGFRLDGCNADDPWLWAKLLSEAIKAQGGYESAVDQFWAWRDNLVEP